MVWLNFWASWCPPCQHETPILRELSERYKDQGLEVIGVSVQETTADDVEVVRRRGTTCTTRSGFDAFGDVFHAYKVFALPTQFFIDPNGVIRQVANGPVDEDAASGADRIDAAAGVERGAVREPRAVSEPEPEVRARSARSGTGRGRGPRGRWGAAPRATARSSQSSSAAWANSSALRTTESSGKSSNAVTQRGLAAHGRMNRSPKNASVRPSSPLPRTTIAWWPVEWPPVGTTADARA